MNKFHTILFLIFALCNSYFSLFSMKEKILYYDSLIPQGTELRSRVLTTICCDDCSYLPRVENAGKSIAEENGLAYQLMHNGIKILKDCYYGSWMTIIIELLKGHHEPQEEKAFYEVLKYMPPNAVMVELGSYWGYYSMWFQQQIPGAQNYLIEPDPKNLVIGQKNFALNNARGHFIQATLGEYSASNQSFIDWDYKTHEVNQMSVDDFAHENNIDFIYMLHSDIQGAEINMLKGCQGSLRKNVLVIFLFPHTVELIKTV